MTPQDPGPERRVEWLLSVKVVTILEGLPETACGCPRWPRQAVGGRFAASLHPELTAAEREQLVRDGFVDLPSACATGRWFRLRFGNELVEMFEADHPVMGLRLAGTAGQPAYELLRLQAIALRGDEMRAMETAERIPLDAE